jgi:CheY-like chemotaxis protein
MAKVMLVEDDNNLREIYQLRLQAEGYDIVTAKDGEEALVVAKAEKPELIISDVMMPKISGFEMLDILRNTDGLKDVKIIMLTALGQTDDQARADKLGADRYLVKSQVTLEDIAKTAHELLEDEAKAADAVLPAAATDVVAAPVQATPVVAAPVATPPAPDPVPAPAEPAASQAAVPAPVATPEPTSPSPDPAASPVAAAPTPVDTTSATSGAQTTAEEEANVEANIENFIAGATTEATPPPNGPENSNPVVAAAPAQDPVPPAPAPAAVAAPAPAPEPAPAPTTSNDQLMTDAVNTINASANQEAAPIAVPAPPPQVATPAAAQPAVAAPDPAPAAPAPTAPAEPAAGSPSSGEQVAIANKKVIMPIDSNPKKDINTLLALEQAKAAANQPPTPVAVIATDENGPEKQPLIAQVQPGVPPTQTNAEGENTPPDPNSIAL